jgi:hypothetical protein
MSLVLRNIKGSELSYTEGDNNLLYLESLAMGLSSSISGLSFSYILGVGNETNGNDIVLSNGDTINADNGGGQLDLRAGSDGVINISNDSGSNAKEFLRLEPGYIEISAVDTGGSRINLFADEYAAAIQLGNSGGAAVADFIIYGSNGFLIESRTEIANEKLTIKHDDLITINCLKVLLPTIPTYADNAAAVAGGLPTNAVYKTATGELRIVV